MKQKPFKVGNYNIGYLSDTFQNHFGEMEFTIPKTLDLKVKKLERNMTDSELLAEFKPKESNLGELAYALTNDICSTDGYANIFYIRDTGDVLWAVYANCYSGYRCWGVCANSVEDPNEWGGGNQIVSCDWGISDPQTLDSLKLSESDSGIEFIEVTEIKWKGRRYKLVGE